MIVRTSAVMCCRHVHRVRSSCIVAFALVLSTRSVDDASNNGEPCFGGEAGAGLDVDVRVFRVTRDQNRAGARCWRLPPSPAWQCGVCATEWLPASRLTPRRQTPTPAGARARRLWPTLSRCCRPRRSWSRFVPSAIRRFGDSHAARDNLIGRTIAVRRVRYVADVNHRRLGQLFSQCTADRQPTDARVEHTDLRRRMRGGEFGAIDGVV